MSELYQGLETVDQEILTILAANSRSSYADIGRQVNLSRASVRSRIQALKERGIIERFSIVVNPGKLGFALAVHFEIEVMPDALKALAEILGRYSNVLSVYHVTGSSRLNVHAVMEGSESLESFLNQAIHAQPGVIKVTTNTVIGCHKRTSGFTT